MSPSPTSQREALSKYAKLIIAAADELTASGYTKRLWRKDATIWSAEPDVRESISNRLGWLDVAGSMLGHAEELAAFAGEVKGAGTRFVVLLGMGGSSLCPEVCARTFGSREGYPELIVLDTTSPDAVLAVRERIDLKSSVFISASKSGSTIETDTLTEYFLAELAGEGVAQPGRHFIAITDPGSPLVSYATDRGFLRTFENPADIGGRYSALSYFGLVPMALIGMDVRALLERAVEFGRQSKAAASVQEDPAARLGVALGTLERAGCDKVTFVLSPEIETFGLWLEQLIAESTGKRGKGIVPVPEPSLGDPAAYSEDRVFVAIGVGSAPAEDKLATLEKNGAPVVRIVLNDVYDLGAEFLRWEIATATAGAVLGVNPFDEPNVTESKKNTSMLLQEHSVTGCLTAPEPLFVLDGLSIAISTAIPREIDAVASGPADILRILLSKPSHGEYFGILAYLPPTPEIAEQIAILRERLASASRRAVTVGFGPRYLHSTGQLHKGGANNGIYFMLMADPERDVCVPQRPYSFGTLFQAQALGDFRSLDGHNRRAVLVKMAGNPVAQLTRITSELMPSS
jgi:transaldolase / glucose-6-phosphate isomerase